MYHLSARHKSIKKRMERIYNIKAKCLHANISSENSNKETDITRNSSLHRKRNRKRLPLKLRRMRMHLSMQSSIISGICCFPLYFVTAPEISNTKAEEIQWIRYVFESEGKQQAPFQHIPYLIFCKGFVRTLWHFWKNMNPKGFESVFINYDNIGILPVTGKFEFDSACFLLKDLKKWNI